MTSPTMDSVSTNPTPHGHAQVGVSTEQTKSKMWAIVHDHYGSPDVLKRKQTDRPVIGDNEVLVRVRRAAVHIGDSFGVRGVPFLMRIATGLFRPRRGIPGYDLAGHVQAVGKQVRRFKPGDAVLGEGQGTCAEFACASETKLIHKPSHLSFEQAAAIPTSGLTALHALRDVAKVRPGHRVLINGASGGVGTFAVQVAKAFGAIVTGVCGTDNVELVRSLGADHVIDYTREDFTSNGSRYDVILDNIENRPLSACRRALTSRGMLILNSGTGATGLRLLLRIFLPLAMTPFVGHRLRRFVSVPNHEDLNSLVDLLNSNDRLPVIDRSYPLSDTAEAIRYLETGHAKGKVIVTIDGEHVDGENGP